MSEQWTKKNGYAASGYDQRKNRNRGGKNQ
jgi:hypothetical protein